MDRIIFPDLDIIQRVRCLDDNADDVIEGYHYERVLDEGELAERKTAFFQRQLEINRIKDELKEITDDLRRKKNLLEKKQDLAMSEITRERESVTEKVWIVKDLSARTAGTYNARGELIAERKLAATESYRQTRLELNERTGTNG